MSEDLSSRTALVMDNGLFLPLARRLARGFGRVLYHTPWVEAFPNLTKAVQGDGFGDVERCQDPWAVLGEVDLVVFPDVGYGPMQVELENMRGLRVWGARRGEELELNRERFMELLGEVGLEVPPHVVVKGWDDLVAELMDREDCYVKLSRWRGTMETTHWRSWELDQDWLYWLATQLGPWKNEVGFVVCEAIPADFEVGADTYCVDGRWPGWMLNGTEAKDKAYLGAVTRKEDMPRELVKVMEAFGPWLEEARYRCQWSMEMRVQGEGDKAYFIDATTRASSPGLASQLGVWGNLPQVMWAGAVGQLVEPEPVAAFSGEVAVCLREDRSQWNSVEVEKEQEEWLALSGCGVVDGKVVWPPGPLEHGNHVGWVHAQGESAQEVVELLKDRVARLPQGLSANLEALADVIVAVEEEQEQGMPFGEGEALPRPGTVLEE